MLLDSRPTITPVVVLQLIRDKRRATLLELMTGLGLKGGNTSRHAENRRFAQVILGLEEVGFIHRTSDAPFPLTPERLAHRILASGWNRHESEQDTLEWAIHERALEVLQALELSLSHVIRNQPNRHEHEVGRLTAVIAELHTMEELRGNRHDLVASLSEMARCLQVGCYIAVMALAGKVLEIVVKNRLTRLGAKFEDNWMLGRLIGGLVDVHDDVFCDQALKNIINIINLSRVSAVHSKTEVPIPSEDQAVMVVRATLDVLMRFIAVRD